MRRPLGEGTDDALPTRSILGVHRPRARPSGIGRDARGADLRVLRPLEPGVIFRVSRTRLRRRAPSTGGSLIDFVGVAVFAVSGALAAGRKRLDLLGVVVIATVTAVGGGTIRDVLLARHPVFWVAEPAFLYVTIGSALLTVAYTRWLPPPDRALAVADALGLALFSISGARIAEAAGSAPVVVVIMGTLTGVAGGVLRDVLTAEIPIILRRGRLYATASIVGTTAYLLLVGVAGNALAAAIGMITIASIRLAAIVWPIQLPVYELERGEQPDASRRTLD